VSAARPPRIAVVLGDPAGVGPEMGVKLLAQAANVHAAQVLLVAAPSVLADGERFAKAKLETLRINRGEPLRFEPGRITHLVLDEPRAGTAPLGECSEAAGQAALDACPPRRNWPARAPVQASSMRP
jgi:4-hydroxythreonine-4-phosphate dehydrogenase